MKYTIFDIEGDSLTPTLIHCISYAVMVDGNLIESGTYRDYEQMRRFFRYSGILVGHNIIRWDVPHIERLLDIKVDNFLIDTLILSWYLYPERIKHGLDPWGEDFGIKKPEIEDWKSLPITDYVYRCEEDVKINNKLFTIQLEYLNRIYDNKQDINSIIKYLMFKMDCAREQEELKWKLDIERALTNLNTFERDLEVKKQALVSHMPEKIEYKEVSVPKKLHKKDGSLSKRGQLWYEILDELGLPEDYQATIQLEKGRENGNPNSHIQLKDWLYTLGWKPVTFKYVKDKETEKVRKVPQVSLPHGAGICYSVRKLYQQYPELENIESYYVIAHRISILKGFLRDMDNEGYLKAEIAGLTNTLRFKHTTIVNLPGYTGKGDWKDGVHIRGVLIAPEDYILCGSDMSSLEDRTKQHYMYYFDPEYVQSMIKPGFDPHLDLAEFAYKMTSGEMGMSPEDVAWYKLVDDRGVKPLEFDRFNILKGIRHDFKTVNYAAVYGSGAPTMSRTSGLSLDKCKILLKAYWDKNWSVKKIAKSCRVQTIDGQMWLFNPVSGFWYSLRYDKDKFSTLNQGTGVFCFDSWVREVRKKTKLCGQFHDELITPIKEENKELTERNLRQAIGEVNNRLKLNRALDIDVAFGNNYAQIH
jgi:hypothetical protein